MDAERLETMLEIAGGAAHEINQPLTAILGYVEMSLVQLEETHIVHRNQKLIADAAVRITEIIETHAVYQRISDTSGMQMGIASSTSAPKGAPTKTKTSRPIAI